MEKNPLPSKPLRLVTYERWKPYIRYNKETDTWISKAIRLNSDRTEEVEEIKEEIKEVKFVMDRKQLDVIARLVAYLYHDKKDEYENLASDMRKEHIYKDLRAIDIWLNSQYRRLENENEQSKQNQGKFL